MATLPKTGTITYEEWLRLPESVDEVVNGEIRVMPRAKSDHVRVVARLVRALQRQLNDRQAEVFSGSFGVMIRKEPVTCRTPDVAVFEAGSWVEINGYFHSPPQLAIEVLSPSESRTTVEEKLRDYEAIGTDEVWVVSPGALTVEVLVLSERRFRREALLADGVLKPRRFPHVEIQIAQIWPD
jgi:Uma2 family endonuclease